MKLFFKDLVTDELISAECESTDTLENLKYQFMAHQSLSISPSDLLIDFVLETDHEVYTELDLRPTMGTLEQLEIREGQIIMFMYSFGA